MGRKAAIITSQRYAARCIASLGRRAKLALFLVPLHGASPKNNQEKRNVIARKRQAQGAAQGGGQARALSQTHVTGRARSREQWTHRVVVGSPADADGTRVGAARTRGHEMMRRLAALVALLTACSSAQMQKSREVRSHEEYHQKRQEQLNRKAQSRKNALKKGGTQSKTLHELRMKKQHKNRAKKQASKKRRPGL